ncbi:hypothetical protein [Mycolicibacterium hippocampi]|uniref:Alpha/beta hydrolase n=1 Tax=Mycolicibacterium hippocampi TaxID=659824 RepID=A0A850PTB4_9MYCO|nr:hypothetical protein [Mycolicibacterium hippocampi]NVN52097.1 hypothetical protein [Mycolicibacterium hippocampi]
MAQLPAWMGAGVLAAGVSAAMIAGADTAGADSGSDTSGAAASSSGSADPGPRGTDRDTGDTDSSKPTDASDTDADTDADAADTEADADEAEVDDLDTADLADEAEDAIADETEDVEDPDDQLPEAGSDDTGPSSGDARPVDHDLTASPRQLDTVDEFAAEPEHAEAPTEEAGEPTAVEAEEQQLPVETAVPAATVANIVAAQRISTTLSEPAALVQPQPWTLQEIVQSLVLDVIGVAVRFISGPPVAAPGTNVTVRSSSLEITEGRTVPADWYYPDGDEPPQRLIYLQHGYLGVGSMYSYTASWLADRTNSIVVVPTLSSNRYVRDGFWLGDDQVHRATADLLLGDRDALTASAVAAGFAKKYGAGVALPETFTLVGHSLGAGVAAGAAGYYADAVIASGATSRLAGIVLLDGAPPGDVLPEALVKLDGLGAYIPVLELGAPRESGARRVDEALNGHRPGHFNGLVLDRGAHLDSMQGGSWLIQLVSYLYQGFPTEQNKAAAQTIIAGWLNDFFAGRIDAATGACEGDDCAGIYGEPGQTVSVETPKGPASGTVIGTAVAPMSTEFQPPSVSSLMATRSTAVRLMIQG